MFPYIGIFSGTPQRRWYAKEDYMKAFEDSEAFRERVKLLFFGYGEQEERIVAALEEQFGEFRDKGIPYTAYTCPGYCRNPLPGIPPAPAPGSTGSSGQ